MNRGVYTFAFIFLLIAAAAGKQERVEVSGIMESAKGPAAVVNGRVCYLKDEVAGGIITAISLDGVTVTRDGKGTVYKVDHSTATTQVSNSKPKKASLADWFKGVGSKKKIKKPKAEGKSSGFSIPKKKSKASSISVLKVPGNAGALSLNQKMRWADKLLDDEAQKSKTFIRGTLSRCSSPDEFGKAMASYSKLSSAYMAEFNKLALPCQGSSSYKQWKKSYMARSRTIRQGQMADIKAEAKRHGMEMCN